MTMDLTQGADQAALDAVITLVDLVINSSCLVTPIAGMYSERCVGFQGTVNYVCLSVAYFCNAENNAKIQDVL